MFAPRRRCEPPTRRVIRDPRTERIGFVWASNPREVWVLLAGTAKNDNRRSHILRGWRRDHGSRGAELRRALVPNAHKADRQLQRPVAGAMSAS